MSTIVTSSKRTTANTVLYKRSKDIPHLPVMLSSDTRRTLKEFKVEPEFKGCRDPTKGDSWPEADDEEHKLIVESLELCELFARLKKEVEVEAEKKRRAEEEKRRKVVLVTLGPRKGKGKGKEIDVEVIDSDSEDEIDGEFRETCLSSSENQVIYIFTHPTNGKKKMACDRCIRWDGKNLLGLDPEAEDCNCLSTEDMYHQYNLMMLESLLCELQSKLQPNDSVPGDLQDVVANGHTWVVTRHNSIAWPCAVNMCQIAAHHNLGKGYIPWVFVLNVFGEVELLGKLEPGKKRSREEQEPKAGPSKKTRVEDKVMENMSGPGGE
ncbi:hypothetical protein M422DRAFT_254564 [Sphaerobolus stellatus SS14]|uniref:Uncharacterized protein n=1 Tax=Sphaerobolus stellatus (strain SS14) TaxID=990650 RepID=A0A0C9UGJ7_SPHS4|nr:hypothetical protein M422DRAFT_254564 [Sphaerobolus stellatus SS14]